MSLIREALKKASDETEFPPFLRNHKTSKGKKPRFFWLKRIGLLVFLLLALGGALVYQFYPFYPARRPVVIQQSIPAPKLEASQEEAKTPEKPPENKPLLAAEKGVPALGPVSPQGQAPTKAKPSPPAAGEIKGALKKPQASIQVNGASEKGPALKAKGDLKATLPPRFISPRPTVRVPARVAASKKPVTRTESRMETPEVSKAQLPQEEKESLEVVRLFNQAVRDQQKGLWDQALQTYEQVLILRPIHWETYNNMGLIYQEQKQTSKAQEMFQKALSLNPRYVKGVNNLGLLYFHQGKWEEAANQFRKVLELDPHFLPAHINLSAVLKRQGKFDQARKSLQKALETDSESLEAHYNLGLLWENEGATKKALEHYQKFVSKAQGPYCELANELRKRWPGLK